MKRTVRASRGTPHDFLVELDAKIYELDGGVGASTSIESSADGGGYLYQVGDDIVFDENYYGVTPRYVNAKIISFGGGLSSHGNMFHGYTVKTQSGREISVSEDRIEGLQSEVNVNSSVDVDSGKSRRKLIRGGRGTPIDFENALHARITELEGGEVTSATNVNSSEGPQTIEDLVGLATQFNLGYEYDDAGNLVVWDENFDPGTDGREDGFTQNIQSFFEAARSNPAFSYEDYDGEYGVGFKGVQGVENVMAGLNGSNAKQWLEELCGYIEEDMFDATYKARCRVITGFSGIPAIEVTCWDGGLDSENGPPKHVFRIREDELHGVSLEGDSAHWVKQMSEYLDAMDGDTVQSSVMAAELGTDDDYINSLAEATLDSLSEKGFQGGYQIQPDGNYLYFEIFDELGEVLATYLQPIADITPIQEDLLDDAESLSDAIIQSVSVDSVESATSIEGDDGYTYSPTQYQDSDEVLRYRGFTVVSWYEPGDGETGIDGDKFGFGIVDSSGNEVDLGASGCLDGAGNLLFDISDEDSVKRAIDEFISDGYKVEDDFDMGTDHYGTSELM